mgnify:CR=1 FL=1
MKLKVPPIKKILATKTNRRGETKKVKHDCVDVDFHKLTFEQLQTRFATSLTNGLDSNVADDLLAKNGRNRIKQKGKNPILRYIGYFFSGFCPIIW